MKRLILVAAILLPASAIAQEFVPFAVEQKDATDIQTYLNDNVPPRYGTPIMNWLNGLEAKAQAAKAEAAKKEEPKK